MRGDRYGAAVVGVGSSRFGRRLGIPVRSLAVDASRAALADAGLRADDLDAVVVESTYVQMAAPPDSVAYELGHRGSFRSLASGIGGAGVVSSLGLAELLVEHTDARHVLCYFAADFGSAAGGPYAFPVAVDTKQRYEARHGWFGQPVYFAAMAERYAATYGIDEESMGAVAVAARQFARLTDDAVLQEELTLDGYRAEPMIAGRFRRADCSIIADGAAAWVVSRADAAVDRPHAPVAILGVGHASEPGHSSDTYFTQRPDFTTTPCTESAAEAFGRAALGPSDVDLAEIYDCFSISTILQLEDAGFCDRGGAPDFARAGALELGGALPTNTHGGLLSHSYTVGGQHIVEAVRQLRGEAGARQVPDAQVAFVAGLGLPEHASAVLAAA